jgi:hypothetical protein
MSLATALTGELVQCFEFTPVAVRGRICPRAERSSKHAFIATKYNGDEWQRCSRLPELCGIAVIWDIEVIAFKGKLGFALLLMSRFVRTWVEEGFTATGLFDPSCLSQEK